ncbi:MAG TPA: 2-isopropylmalate synthase [Candidatus Acidoferrales bacterium]|nr:2-isopropylmalate synthase [Candidatus Acidoferrales bacterium]
MNRTVTFFDTTLRDGEQTPSVSFTTEDKVIIARALDKLGVDVIEAGFPISSTGELDAVKKVAHLGLRATICGNARVLTPDIDACLNSDVGLIHVFASTSDVQLKYSMKKTREEVYEMSIDAVDYVKDHGVRCLFSAMDATRTDLQFLLRICKGVESAKVDIINIPDTVGIMAPFKMYALIRAVKNAIQAPIDVHCHNDFGLAVANSISAVEAGANQVQVTVNGIGERAGNADLAQTVMSLHSIYNIKSKIMTKYLLETSRLVERYTKINLQPNMPIVGENAFSHESGIHSRGVIARPDTFEPGIMTPEMVGHHRRLIAGKHAGKHGIKEMLKDAGFEPSEEQLTEITKRIKEIGDKGKRVTDLDLYTIAEAVTSDVLQPSIMLEEVSVMTGNRVTPTATVKAIVDGKEMVGARIGVGPVDAAINAVHEIIGGAEMQLRTFKIESISGGTDALAEVIIGVEDDKGNIVTARAAREDIVLASVEAMVSAMNRLKAKNGGQ